MIEYEEHKKGSEKKSWILIIGLISFLLIMAMSMMYLIEDVPREWDFGNVEFTPGKSVYSTAIPEEISERKMIIPLPEGKTMEEINQDEKEK